MKAEPLKVVPMMVFGSPYAILAPLWMCPMCGRIVNRDDLNVFTRCGEHEAILIVEQET